MPIGVEDVARVLAGVFLRTLRHLSGGGDYIFSMGVHLMMMMMIMMMMTMTTITKTMTAMMVTIMKMIAFTVQPKPRRRLCDEISVSAVAGQMRSKHDAEATRSPLAHYLESLRSIDNGASEVTDGHQYHRTLAEKRERVFILGSRSASSRAQQ